MVGVGEVLISAY